MTMIAKLKTIKHKDIKIFMLYSIAPTVPVFQLIASLYSSFFELSCLNHSDTIGYSLLTDLVYVVLFFFAVRYKYCIIPRVATASLILMNIVSLLGVKISYYEYSTVYDSVIPLVCFFTGVIIWLNKK